MPGRETSTNSNKPNKPHRHLMSTIRRSIAILTGSYIRKDPKPRARHLGLLLNILFIEVVIFLLIIWLL